VADEKSAPGRKFSGYRKTGDGRYYYKEDVSMPKIRFVPPDIEIETESGVTLLDAALDNNIWIDHNCGGNCACSTCHVVIEEGFDSLNEVSEDELDMLDEVEDLTESSRLACQCRVSSDLVVRIPRPALEEEDGTF
jgi:2Fe-2S ferredoxin